MNKINIGCGPDLKEGWTNTDNNMSGNWVEGLEWWDITYPAPTHLHNKFDFALVNHTLCLLSYEEVQRALLNIKDVLKEGGILEIIDMDTLKAFKNMEDKNEDGFPGFAGDIQDRMCHHIVGYGRKSIYTPHTMYLKLQEAGYKDIWNAQTSEHDLRPIESFVIQAVK